MIIPLDPFYLEFKNIDKCPCNNQETEDEFFRCFEENNLSTNELIYNQSFKYEGSKFVFANFLASRSFNALPFYNSIYNGLGQFLMLDTEAMTEHPWSTMNFLLNNSLSYDIRFMDPKLQLQTGSPETIPRTLISKT